MATVGSFLPISHSATASTSSNSQNTSSSSTTSGSSSLSNQSAFLQLLVAQLQHQDPTQPVDGTTFVTQLATFSDVQANLGTKSDLDAISKQYLGTTTAPSATQGSSSGSTSQVTGG